MTSPPRFDSRQDYVARRCDVEFWSPHLAEILDRHGLRDDGREPVSGYNPTNPTFVCGDVVVKLFGSFRGWRERYAAERDTHRHIATDLEIAAPRVVADGRLFEDGDAPWPYLVTTRMPGVAWRDAGLSVAEQRAVAAEVGAQVRRLHALPAEGADCDGNLDVAAAAARSSLPPHLVTQVDEFLDRLGPVDPVFVHGDLVAMHVFVDGGRLAGIIDWGDALVTDRHVELIQPLRDLFECDGELLRVFLEAAEWPIGEDFARRALGFALHRQALGLVQHFSMDVFEPIAERFPLHDIPTLDDLANDLFGVAA